MNAREEFSEVWLRFHGDVVRYVACRVGPDAAPDLVSETFEAALASIQSFDAERYDGGWRPWLLGIANRVVSRHHRTELRWISRLRRSQPDTFPSASDPDDRIPGLAQRQSLLRALGDLMPDERSAFLMHALGDLSYQQIAAACGIEEGTAKSRVSRARAKLAGQLEEITR